MDAQKLFSISCVRFYKKNIKWVYYDFTHVCNIQKITKKLVVHHKWRLDLLDSASLATNLPWKVGDLILESTIVIVVLEL
jgi:hypothetical protein